MLCDNHFKKTGATVPSKESEADRKKREKEWADARAFLNNQRLLLNTMANVEEKLAEYRAEHGILTSSERLAEMRKEKHHPAQRKLGANLMANHEPQPSTGHVAHHIVPGKGRWRQRELRDIRSKLHMSGRRINDPDNGVWLQHVKSDDPNWATPNSPDHKTIHRFNYETWVHRQLTSPLVGPAFLKKLGTIKTLIKNGRHPVKITLDKDSEWIGDK